MIALPNKNGATKMIFTDDDLMLAFDVADDELHCDFCCDIEKVHPEAYLNDDYWSLKALQDWMDAISNMPDDQKIGVVFAMMCLPTCNVHIMRELEKIQRARELDAEDAKTDAKIYAAGYL